MPLAAPQVVPLQVAVPEPMRNEEVVACVSLLPLGVGPNVALHERGPEFQVRVVAGQFVDTALQLPLGVPHVVPEQVAVAEPV